MSRLEPAFQGTDRSFTAGHPIAPFGMLAIVFLAALAARLAFLAWRGPLLTWDSGEYLRLAQNVRDHGAYSLDAVAPFVPSIRRSPLYPGFLAALGWWGGPSPLTVAVVQAGMDAGAAVLVLLLARIAMPTRWAMGAALAYALYPGSIATSSMVLSETLFTAVLVVGVTATAAGQAKDRPGFTALGGVALGLAALCRPVALLIPLVLGAVLLLARGVPRPRLHAALLALCAALAVAPWAVRCIRVSHHLVLVQGLSAANFYVATRSDWDQLDQEHLWPRFSGQDPYGRRLAAARSPVEVAEADRFGFRQGVRNILANPAGYARSRLRSFPPFFLTSFDFFTGLNQSFGQAIVQRNVRTLVLKAALLVLFSVTPVLLGVVGLVRARKNPAAALCAGVWGYLWLAHLPMWVEYRYWLPAMPFLLVSAARGAHLALGAVMPRTLSTAAAIAACLGFVLQASPAHAGPLDRTPNPNLRKLYRFRPADSLNRSYTTSSDERFQFLNTGLVPEGVLGQVRPTAMPGTVPLYGVTLENGEEILTTDEYEVEELRARSGSSLRGVLGYIYTSAPAGVPTVPFYRLFTLRTGLHVFTADPVERDRLLADGYVLQGRGSVYGYLVNDLSDTNPLFIAPIHERAYTDGRTLAELRRLKQLLAPNGGGPSVRLGWTKSYWYLKDDGAGAILDDILELAHSAPIPLVIVFNGGRWMSDNPEASQLDSLRQLGESVPLYRLRVPVGSLNYHLYTIDPEEKGKSKGTYEGITAGVYHSQVQGTVPLYRIYIAESGDHFYTIDSAERSAALAKGGIDEKVAAYVFPQPTEDTVPLYRLYNPGTAEHLYTTDAPERAGLIQGGSFWDDGIACYVLPSPLTTLNQEDRSLFGWDPGKQFMCLSRLNRIHYRRKRQALIRAAQRVAAWAKTNPALLVGVTIDSETLLNDNPGLGYADYNPLAIEEWRQWMSNTGIYDPVNGEYRGQGRKPALTLVDIGGMTGRGYGSWSEVQPPRTATGGMFWQIWRDFGRAMVRNHNQDMADWLAAGGIPRNIIFAHQTPNLSPEGFGDVPETAILSTPEGVPLTGGITAYGANARRYSLFSNLVSRGIEHWGLFEYNPTDLGGGLVSNYADGMSSLMGIAASDVSIIAPYKWPKDEETGGDAIENTPFQQVLADFIRLYGSALR